MAQWQGQFSGFTHETKVQDLEESLRRAIRSAGEAGPVDRDRKLKAMWHVAERVLSSRSKALRARKSALTEPGRESEKAIVKLQEREIQLDQAGVKGILREFGAPLELWK